VANYFPNGYQQVNALTWDERLKWMFAQLDNGRLVLVMNQTTTPIEAFSLDPTTGALTVNNLLASSLTFSGGQLLLPDGTNVAPILARTLQTGTGIYFDGSNALRLAAAGTAVARIDNSGNLVLIGPGSGAGLYFADTNGALTNAPILARIANNILEVQGGTGANPQTLRICSQTDGTNKEYAVITKVNNGQVRIGSAAGGTGVARQISVGFGNTNESSWSSVADFDGNGVTVRGSALLFNPDNSADIGASGATRPRHVYVGTDIVFPTGTQTLPYNGTIPTVQTFSASGTYTPSAGMKWVYVIVKGGGGSGGGSTNAAGNGGGGGEGETTFGIFTAAQIGASKAVTIAAAAASIAANTNSTGNTGGTCSLGTLITAVGGIGGNSGNTGAAGGQGGSGGTSQWWEAGAGGACGGTADVAHPLNGAGGGRGGGSTIAAGGTPNSGGGGGSGSTTQISGAGATGKVTVIEYYS